MSEMIKKPPTVEYVVLKPQTQKKLAAFRILIAIGILILVAITSISIDRYIRRNSVRKLSPIVLAQLGLRTTLKTEWLDGAPHYLFLVRSNNPENKARLDAVLQTYQKPLRFFVALKDRNGFELCSSSVSWHREQDEKGRFAGIDGQGIFNNCPESKYKKTTSWNISFVYPTLTEPLQLPTVGIEEPAQRTTDSKPKLRLSNTKFSIEDTLTGADFLTGNVELLSGGSYRVAREAEYMTLAQWTSGNKVKVSCVAASCVITNEERSESVHASKRN